MGTLDKIADSPDHVVNCESVGTHAAEGPTPDGIGDARAGSGPGVGAGRGSVCSIHRDCQCHY